MVLSHAGDVVHAVRTLAIPSLTPAAKEGNFHLSPAFSILPELFRPSRVSHEKPLGRPGTKRPGFLSWVAPLLNACMDIPSDC